MLIDLDLYFVVFSFEQYLCGLAAQADSVLTMSTVLSALLRCGESLQYLKMRNTLLLGNRLPVLPHP